MQFAPTFYTASCHTALWPLLPSFKQCHNQWCTSVSGQRLLPNQMGQYPRTRWPSSGSTSQAAQAWTLKGPQWIFEEINSASPGWGHKIDYSLWHWSLKVTNTQLSVCVPSLFLHKYWCVHMGYYFYRILKILKSVSFTSWTYSEEYVYLNFEANKIMP